MPTTANGVYYPDSATNITPLETVFSTMASSIDNILAGDVQIHRVANTTARNALAASLTPTAANPVFVWRADAPNGQELEYTKNGTTWYYVNTSEDDTGWVAITPAGGFTATGAALRKIGNTVYARGYVSGTIPANTTTNVGPVPSGMIPAGGLDWTISAVGQGNGAIIRAGVSGGGQIQVFSTVTTSSAVYLKGLSGYLVA
jgi:hypothetical protein